MNDSEREDGTGRTGLIGVVFAALVVGGAGTYLTTIDSTRERAQQTASDLSRFQAEVVGQGALTNLKIDALASQLAEQRSEVRELTRAVKLLERRR